MPEEVYFDLQAKILRFLSYKPRTVGEVIEKAQEELSSLEDLSDEEKEDIIAKITQNLLKSGYLDDRDYALSYIEEQKAKPVPKGPRYITRFLLQKHIPKVIIENALNQALPFEEEQKIIQKILTRYKSEDLLKIINYLRQKGFNYNTICSLVDINTKRN